MSLNKEDIWGDLMYTLDELNRTPLDIGSRLTDAANLDAQPEDEFFNRFLQIGMFSTAYSKAKMRADANNAHEAIEKGLKAILLDGGLTEKDVRIHGHELHLLLADVKQRNPKVFSELERCFDSAIQYLEVVTTIRHNTNIVDYFCENGKAETFVANRYASIGDVNNPYGGMILFVQCEIIRALLSLIFDWTPKDIDFRIEEEARKAISAERKLDPAWDAEKWLIRGSVRPRLEVVENLKNNKVLRAAVRRCARESKDRGIRNWAKSLRHNLIEARRKERSDHRLE